MNFESTNGQIIVTSISSIGVGWRSPDGSTWGTVPKALSIHPSVQEDYHAIVSHRTTPTEMYDLLAKELSTMTPGMVEKAFYNCGGNHFFNPDRGHDNPFTMDDWESLICAINNYPDRLLSVDEEVWYYWLEVLPPIAMHCMIHTSECVERKAQFITGEGLPLIAGFIGGPNQYYLMGVLDNPITIKDRGLFTAEELYYGREKIR